MPTTLGSCTQSSGLLIVRSRCLDVRSFDTPLWAIATYGAVDRYDGVPCGLFMRQPGVDMRIRRQPECTWNGVRSHAPPLGGGFRAACVRLRSYRFAAAVAARLGGVRGWPVRTLKAAPSLFPYMMALRYAVHQATPHLRRAAPRRARIPAPPPMSATRPATAGADDVADWVASALAATAASATSEPVLAPQGPVRPGPGPPLAAVVNPLALRRPAPVAVASGFPRTRLVACSRVRWAGAGTGADRAPPQESHYARLLRAARTGARRPAPGEFGLCGCWWGARGGGSGRGPG